MTVSPRFGTRLPPPRGADLFDKMLRLILENIEPDATPERFTELIRAATDADAVLPAWNRRGPRRSPRAGYSVTPGMFALQTSRILSKRGSFKRNPK